MQTKLITIGTNRGKPRIWIEGEWLHNLGFVRGAHFTATLDGRVLTLKLAKADAEKVRTVSGKDKAGKPHPIIDLAGEWLQPLVTADRKVTLAMAKGKIVITRPDAAQTLTV
jgi:DNA (cytosine-5)-methyltransferase 1